MGTIKFIPYVFLIQKSKNTVEIHKNYIYFEKNNINWGMIKNMKYSDVLNKVA